jgi:hypothetical protein
VTDQPRYQPGKARPGGNPPADPRGVPPQPQPGGLLPDAVDPWIADSETVRATRDDLFAPGWDADPAPNVEEPAYGVAAPVWEAPPKPRRTGLISTIIVLVLLAAAVGGYFAFHSGSQGLADSAGLHATPPASTGPTVTSHPSASASAPASSGTGAGAVTPSASPSTKTGQACANGSWTLTAETITVDSDAFGLDGAPIKLTAQNPNETRVFFPDHTGKIDVHNTDAGTAADGTPVSVVLIATGASFEYTYDGTTIDYTKVQMPGTNEVDVNGVTKAISHQNPLYQTGSAAMSCTGDTLIQSGPGYSRTYTRKPL